MTTTAAAVTAQTTQGWQEIAALAEFLSEAEVIESLKKITSAYGKVTSINPLPLADTNEIHTKRLYMVDYARSEDAMAAAQSIRCYLYGFSTLMIAVPKTGSDKACFISVY